MTDNQQDIELKKELNKIDWAKFFTIPCNSPHGSVKFQLREGEPKLLTIYTERTVKLD